MRIFLTDYRTASTTETALLEDIKYPQQVHWFPETYARVSTGMFYPPHRVADKVLDPALLAQLRDTPCRTAFILASGSGHFAGTSRPANQNNCLAYVYKFLPLTLTHIYAGRTAQSCGATDYVMTDASACASGLKVMGDVRMLINHLSFDRVVVLAVEDQVCNMTLDFFGETRASLQGADGLPSAFDAVNGGFHVGQGAAFAVFESERIAQTQEIELLGAATASEPLDNALGQREDGLGFQRAMHGAIASAGVTADDIRVVKTHGTGTASNNVAERAALEATLPQFVATSYKARIGHTLGASGLLETLLLLEDMAQGIVPKILNRTAQDAVYLSDDIAAPEGLVMSLAAGMGNIYSAAIFKRG